MAWQPGRRPITRSFEDFTNIARARADATLHVDGATGQLRVTDRENPFQRLIIWVRDKLHLQSQQQPAPTRHEEVRGAYNRFLQAVSAEHRYRELTPWLEDTLAADIMAADPKPLTTRKIRDITVRLDELARNGAETRLNADYFSGRAGSNSLHNMLEDEAAKRPLLEEADFKLSEAEIEQLSDAIHDAIIARFRADRQEVSRQDGSSIAAQLVNETLAAHEQRLRAERGVASATATQQPDTIAPDELPRAILPSDTLLPEVLSPDVLSPDELPSAVPLPDALLPAVPPPDTRGASRDDGQEQGDVGVGDGDMAAAQPQGKVADTGVRDGAPDPEQTDSRMSHSTLRRSFRPGRGSARRSSTLAARARPSAGHERSVTIERARLTDYLKDIELPKEIRGAVKILIRDGSVRNYQELFEAVNKATFEWACANRLRSWYGEALKEQNIKHGKKQEAPAQLVAALRARMVSDREALDYPNFKQQARLLIGKFVLGQPL